MSEQHASGPGGEHGADDHDVHLYEGSGIEEGNAPVPTWYKFVMLGLAIFLVCYLAMNLTGWQPWAAKFKS